MSKESYIRGFCKAAEAKGVDPKALAKYAQQYKTDGYVPPLKDDAAPFAYPYNHKYRGDWINIPYMYTSSVGRRSPSWRQLLSSGGSYNPEISSDHRLHAELDPRFANWIAAHTNASAKAHAPLDRAEYPQRTEIPKDLGEMIAKIYHDEMKRTTSAPPAQVSAPISKK